MNQKTNTTIKVGDRVRVVNNGAIYSSYDEMAKKMDLLNWVNNVVTHNGNLATVIDIQQHPSHHNTTVCGIRTNDDKDIVIGLYGLELINLPAKWCIEYTRENAELLESWRQKKASKVYADHSPSIGYTLLSEHPEDSSYYYSTDIKTFQSNYSDLDYQPITFEQFKKDVLNLQEMTKKEPLKPEKEIAISREVLNTYYEAATSTQKKFIADNFKMNGETTVGAIRELHKMACAQWQKKIASNHPDCMIVDDKYFDLASLVDSSEDLNDVNIFNPELTEKAGLSATFFQIRVDGEYGGKGFYLSDSVNWEIIIDSHSVKVLVPTKKGK